MICWLPIANVVGNILLIGALAASTRWLCLGMPCLPAYATAVTYHVLFTYWAILQVLQSAISSHFLSSI